MTEETYEITFTPTFTQRLGRSEIEMLAAAQTENLGIAMRAKVEACREWLEANPQGMTRDEFNALPDGTILDVHGANVVKVRDLVYSVGPNDTLNPFRPHENWICEATVVFTPAQPTLEEVDYWLSEDDIWQRTTAGWGSGYTHITTEELLELAPLTPLLPGPQIGGEA